VALAPTTGINLEKVDTSRPCVVDENYTVLLGKCSNTKKTYLVNNIIGYFFIILA
jgi:hypothetical protein